MRRWIDLLHDDCVDAAAYEALLAGHTPAEPQARFPYWEERLSLSENELDACLLSVSGRGAKEAHTRRKEAKPIIDAAVWLLWLGTTSLSEALPDQVSRNLRVVNLSIGDLQPFIDYIRGLSGTSNLFEGVSRNSVTNYWQPQRSLQEDLLRVIFHKSVRLRPLYIWLASIQADEPSETIERARDLAVAKALEFRSILQTDPVLQLARMFRATLPIYRPVAKLPILSSSIDEMQILQRALSHFLVQFEAPAGYHGRIAILAQAIYWAAAGSLLEPNADPSYEAQTGSRFKALTFGLVNNDLYKFPEYLFDDEGNAGM